MKTVCMRQIQRDAERGNCFHAQLNRPLKRKRIWDCKVKRGVIWCIWQESKDSWYGFYWLWEKNMRYHERLSVLHVCKPSLQTLFANGYATLHSVAFSLHYDRRLPHQTVIKQTCNLIFNGSLLCAWRLWSWGQLFSCVRLSINIRSETPKRTPHIKCTGVVVDGTFCCLVKRSWYLSRVFTFKMSTVRAFAVPVTVLGRKALEAGSRY